jgi:hypothetical protein
MSAQQALDEMEGWCLPSPSHQDAMTHCIHIEFTDGLGQPMTQKFQGLLFYWPTDPAVFPGLAAAVYLPGKTFPARPWVGFNIPAKANKKATIKQYKPDAGGNPSWSSPVTLTMSGKPSLVAELHFENHWWIAPFRKTTAGMWHLDVGNIPIPGHCPNRPHNETSQRTASTWPMLGRRALDDSPPGLEELRAVLLREHVGRVRDGLV